MPVLISHQRSLDTGPCDGSFPSPLSHFPVITSHISIHVRSRPAVIHNACYEPCPHDPYAARWRSRRDELGRENTAGAVPLALEHLAKVCPGKDVFGEVVECARCQRRRHGHTAFLSFFQSTDGDRSELFSLPCLGSKGRCTSLMSRCTAATPTRLSVHSDAPLPMYAPCP